MPYGRLRRHWIAVPVIALSLAACGGGGGGGSDGDPDSGLPGETAPTTVACASGVPAGTSCWGGRDANGAYYRIAMPSNWNGTLVLHAHGGPSLGSPTAASVNEDLTRWAVWLRAGYAWAGSSFRQGGVEVSDAAADTERLRRIVRAYVATPDRTLLHGQSWGASVAVKAAERYTAETLGGSAPYDGVLLTGGVLGGGTRSYDFRLDLRVVYQYLCNNHPRPDETAYALNIGLPSNATLTRSQLNARINECLGLDRSAAQRSAAQQQRIDTIERVIRIPASSIESHLAWGTFHFQDIVSRRTGGGSPFGNIGAIYGDSEDDAALNAGVARYAANADAVQRFAEDADPEGRIPVPVLSVRWIDDPTAFVELDAYFRDVMEHGGSGERLVQTFTSSRSHAYLSHASYAALAAALLDWIAIGSAPTPTAVAQRCVALNGRFGGGCSFVPDYVPAALETRVPARERP
jgi:hypothetical protein